jgi:hypothetical protein
MTEIRANMDTRRQTWPADLPSAAHLIVEGREARERDLAHSADSQTRDV